MPRVLVLGASGDDVECFEDVGHVVNASSLHTCERKKERGKERKKEEEQEKS